MSHVPASSPADHSPARPERLWRELVGHELRSARQERGESLRRVAQRARVSPQYLSEIERGFKEPSSEILAALAAALGLSLLDLTIGVAERLAPSSGPAASKAPAAAPSGPVVVTAFALAA